MIRTLMKNWWLLALCGIFDAFYSAVDLVMEGPGGSFSLRTHALAGTVPLLGKAAIAAGVCGIAAGLWRSAQGKSWLLVLNGVTLGTLGVILNGALGPQVSFRTVALLVVVIAISIGIFELAIARVLRRADEWILGLAGTVSVLFGLAFLGFALRWIDMGRRPEADFLWFGGYFGFSAVCMLGLALRLHRLTLSPAA